MARAALKADSFIYQMTQAFQMRTTLEKVNPKQKKRKALTLSGRFCSFSYHLNLGKYDIDDLPQQILRKFFYHLIFSDPQIQSLYVLT